MAQIEDFTPQSTPREVIERRIAEYADCVPDPLTDSQYARVLDEARRLSEQLHSRGLTLEEIRAHEAAH